MRPPAVASGYGPIASTRHGSACASSAEALPLVKRLRYTWGMKIPRLLTVAQAAERFGISVSGCRALCVQGRIKGAVKVGGVWLIPDPPVIDWPRMGRPPWR